MITNEERRQNIEKLKNACVGAGFIEVAPQVFEFEGSFSRTITLCTLVRGNEIGGIEVFLDFLKDYQSGKVHLKSNLRLILGNVEAYYEDKRFLETDLNRSFDLEAPKTREEHRARELEPYLAASDIFIDIHQTIGPSRTPFFIFEYEPLTYDLARFLHASLPIITYTSTRAFSGKTSTGYVISRGGLGVTIETGQKGIESSQISLGSEIIRKTIESIAVNSLPVAVVTKTYTFSQILNNPAGNLTLLKEYNNFDPVRKGEILARGLDQEIEAEVDGVILFPKYGAHAKASAELALILKEVTSREDF